VVSAVDLVTGAAVSSDKLRDVDAALAQARARLEWKVVEVERAKAGGGRRSEEPSGCSAEAGDPPGSQGVREA
jgi:hypothetical protein